MDKIVILILVATFGIIFALVPSRTYNILTKTLSLIKKEYVIYEEDMIKSMHWQIFFCSSGLFFRFYILFFLFIR